MNRTKLIIGGIIVLLAVVVVLQNTDPVQTSILFFSFTVPRAFLLFSTFVAGFVVGVLWTTKHVVAPPRD